jgi:hypothetical protein
VAFVDADRYLDEDIARAVELIHSGRLSPLASD